MRDDNKVTIETIKRENREKQGESYLEEVILELSEKLDLANNVKRKAIKRNASRGRRPG